MPKELIIPEDQVQQVLLDAITLLQKIRFHKKKWDEHYGSQNRSNLRHWEDRADAFLASLNIQPINPDDDARK